MYSLSLLKRSIAFSDPLATRIFTRLMGGGPRTFPGGINKWQWKRLHEKRAREKERRLLQQEKQLYQARVRSEIRAERTGKPESNGSDYGPMSSEDHVRVLANRFMKEGAEDLWNDNDGPLKSPRPRVAGPVGPNQLRGSINSPIDLRKLFSEGRNVAWDGENGGSGHGYVKARDYSVQRGADFQPGSGPVVRFAGNLVGEERKFRRNEGSSGDEDSSYGSGKVLGQDFVNKHRNSFPVQEQGRFQRNGSSSSDDDEDGGVRGPRWLGVIGGRGELGKYDVKITKRVPLKKLEEDELAQEVEMIRYQHKQRKLAVNEMEKKMQKDEEESILSQKRFDESGISPLTVKALTAAGYVQMTRVQEASLPVCLEGKDALVKAKTGTGKTASFLLPAIEAVLKATSNNANSWVHPIHVLILCPTRELGRQIAAEANAILKYHDGIGVQTLVGGTRFKDDLKRLQSDSCQIIVATPGRLLDHIENKGGLSVRLMGLKMLVLDEADHLLDLGFRKDIEKIVDCLPRQRLSLLFTSTIPKEVCRIAQLVLRREHAFVDTVGIGSVETHAKVKQSFLVVPHELRFLLVHHLLKEHILHTPHYKVIVFCTTGMVTSLLYILLRHMKMNVMEMHSRKPQIYRTRVSDEFRESKRMILVTSDVSARGMNYPDVTLVIQVGIPCDREQYIHRLGRTGREGKDGEGILLLAPWEEYFLDAIKDLPLEKLPSPEIDAETKLKVGDSMSKIDNSVKEAAYHAWLGYYNSVREIGRDKTTLVELANQFCESIGLQKPPPLFRKTALKMGLKGIAGIRIRQ